MLSRRSIESGQMKKASKEEYHRRRASEESLLCQTTFDAAERKAHFLRSLEHRERADTIAAADAIAAKTKRKSS
jgi:hypothetical protein